MKRISNCLILSIDMKILRYHGTKISIHKTVSNGYTENKKAKQKINGVLGSSKSSNGSQLVYTKSKRIIKITSEIDSHPTFHYWDRQFPGCG
mmetsp:Transcript_43174/g.49636  ORF Transcript_43174/g.49636 Transcript_43174/m.49636 type:complete len:92 (+) Transcript_43174:71-346(+)